MSRLPLFASAVVVLVVASAAGAKGPMPTRICGSSGCVPLAEPAAAALAEGLGSPFTLLAPPRPAPFYVIRLRRFDDNDPVPRPWIFARGAIRIAQPGERPYWRTLPAGATTALNKLATRLAPYPASSGWRLSR
jgi:hypothetical protein